MSFVEETQSIRNIITVEVLIFNPNDPYISVHIERGSVTHSSSRDRYIDDGLRSAGSVTKKRYQAVGFRIIAC